MFCAGAKAEPVQIKTGISDGMTTEVLEGLDEKEIVLITGRTQAPNAATSPQQGNPFGARTTLPMITFTWWRTISVLSK